MRKYLYLLSLLFVFIIPTLVIGSFIEPHMNIWDLTVFALGIMIVGSAWDIWATRHGRTDSVWLWQFNKINTLGIQFLGLPVEEYLFYLSTSIYILFTWETFQYSTANNGAGSYFLVFTGIWSLAFIILPYSFNIRGDKLR